MTLTIPKISRPNFTRIKAVAMRLAEIDGWEVEEKGFNWLRIEPYLRCDVNPRAALYAFKAIEVCKVVDDWTKKD